MADKINSAPMSETETRYTFFAKTDQNAHTGGLVVFSAEEADAASEMMEREARHLADANGETLQSWGLTDAAGNVFREFAAESKK